MTPKPESAAKDAVLIDTHPLGETGAYAALLTLNRPHELNPLDLPMLLRLRELLAECDADDSVRVILITGAGTAFSAGGDLKKYIAMQKDPVGWSHFLEEAHLTFLAMRLHRKPVVSLVNGVAVAGGLEVIVCSDFAYAAESARIGDAHLRYGQMGGGGALSLIPRAIGAQRARELIFSGRILPAAEALEWNIVSRVVPDDQLLPAGLEFAEHVARMSPLAVANAKFVINESIETGLGVAAQMRLELERAARYNLTSHDAAEGLIAFSEKRVPKFLGK
ncbi:enoyl-CoA hydratase [Acrocarpospora pleiomorpha]|uniref:Enoyl-CoA hydratase n=1 Tax=Acrocarpospora pleiomorpha TaxID=90975 RepID=A0A5M3XCS4_9ACTN|nr:enoyl-CoA hydratase/isomerase family protein [Acrocarpospora pleiomorpha]GES17311.1 enoyl-CoA hydratase [Acrocarpospora pleiomorpha]